MYHSNGAEPRKSRGRQIAIRTVSGTQRYPPIEALRSPGEYQSDIQLQAPVPHLLLSLLPIHAIILLSEPHT